MAARYTRGSCSITLEMLRTAVEELEKRRASVSFKMIANHLRKFYPIEQNLEELKIQLKDKLDHAVSIGILARSRRDVYTCSTFRQEAYNYKTDLTSFWERYYKKRPGRRLRSTRFINKKKSVGTQSYNSSDNSSDDYSDSDC